jgi:hypothetical protein
MKLVFERNHAYEKKMLFCKIWRFLACNNEECILHQTVVLSNQKSDSSAFLNVMLLIKIWNEL